MAARAKDDGADIVMVGLHWGLEYYHPPTEDQIDVAEKLATSPDIDFIYGEHAHVVQPFDRVNGTWVVYGLGNQVAQQDTAVEGVYDGVTCRVTFKERRDGSFKVEKLEYIPTMITHFDGVHPMRLLNVPASLDDPRYASLRPSLLATQQRVKEVIGSLGAFKKGVVEGE
jgi:poly-gamma-glutamate capsule biosynthesis protein CapA/YwtB (metallophosphatase superfamily)